MNPADRFIAMADNRYCKMYERNPKIFSAFDIHSLFTLSEQYFVNHRKHHYAVRGQAPV
jgi:hypothetical protein